MDIQVADQRILVFSTQLTPDDAKKKALDKKMAAFDVASKVTSFLSRPKDEDFELIYEENRYQPFWHVSAKAKYVYDRTVEYQVPTSGKEVKSVTLQNASYTSTNEHIHLSVTEHCQEEEADEVFVDGVSGKPKPEVKRYLIMSPKEVKKDLESMVEKGSILVPPQTRVSAIMRDALAKMIKGIQADTILEEKVEVSCVDLYYHPIFAFQFRWISKNKEGILEIDGLTGEVSSGNRTFREYMGKVLNRDFLFDVGADAAGILIPGGSIAVKVAKRYMETKK